MIRWLAAGGVFVVSLDSTVNVAFPAIAGAFDAPPEQVRWIILCYVLMYALVSFVGGTAGDRLGHHRVFRAGAAGSALGFAICAAAPAFGWLLVGRLVQGLGGGLVYGTAPALVTLGAEPGARGRALGFLNGAMGLAFTAGPLAAGVLVDAFGWRSIFAVRIPLALALFVWALGLDAARGGAVSRLVGAGDVVRGPVLRAGALAFLANAAIFAVWLLAPFYLIERRGLTAPLAGVIFMLTPLGTTIAAPLAGRVADRAGPWPPVLVGLALEAGGLFLMSRADPTTPSIVVALALFAAGFGLGLFQVPNMAALMAEFAPAHQGAAGGFAFLSRTLGIVVGVLTLAALFGARRASAGFDVAFAEAFLLATGLAALAAVGAAASAPRRRGRDRPHRP